MKAPTPREAREARGRAAGSATSAAPGPQGPARLREQGLKKRWRRKIKRLTRLYHTPPPPPLPLPSPSSAL
jgi:hypothetical protein